jgi:hypothetical protein
VIVDAMVDIVTRLNQVSEDVTSQGEAIERLSIRVTESENAVLERIGGLSLQLEELLDRQTKLSSLRGYDPELTPAGGIRLGESDWQRVVERLDKQEAAVKIAENRAAVAEAAQALVAQERDQFGRRVKWWLSVIGLGGGILGAIGSTVYWLLSHVTIHAAP